jgi:nucleotide-binding universal stress UspA family protein
MQLDTILLPVDGSDHSIRAAEYAADLAGQYKASIVLVHCHPPVPITLGEPRFQDAISHYQEESEKILAPFRPVLSGLPVTERVIGGRARDVIPEVAETEKADLIVMGARGLSRVESALLGSVTQRIIAQAGCPVLVVR